MGDPVLVLTEQLINEPSPRYATLSHRWSTAANVPLLLKANLLELQNRIPVTSITKVFRDAVEVCHCFIIHYLWIDALCFIQNDITDCEKEIANMGNIYMNAYLNLGAAGAADAPERGLCYESDHKRLLPFHVPVHRNGQAIVYLAYHHNTIEVLGSESLMSHGWVLQEQMLSPRSIHFDDVRSWECHDMLANEIFPRGIPWSRESSPD